MIAKVGTYNLTFIEKIRKEKEYKKKKKKKYKK